MMRRPAGFDADPRRRQLLKELNNLPPPQLLAQHRLLGRIHTMQLKNTLGRVHSNADKIVHGRPPCLRSTTTAFWHIDAVGGRPPQQPLALMVKEGIGNGAENLSPRRMGPGVRRDDPHDNCNIRITFGKLISCKPLPPPASSTSAPAISNNA